MWDVLAFVVGPLICAAGPYGVPTVVQDYTIRAKTSPPFTYCIWYLGNPEDAEFLSGLAASPPDLFHLGFHIPFKGMLGPTYGHELFTNEILPPEEVGREVVRVRRILLKVRGAGVHTVIPYVLTMAFFGSHEDRTGFFKFYDHWEDYASFGLGPKPAADPVLWQQERAPRPLSEEWPGTLVYEPCVNHPGWQRYLDVVVRELAKAGYDGMFFDVNTLYCYCPYCEAAFDVYLLDKHGQAGLQEGFGASDHRTLNLSTIYRDFEAVILQSFKDHLKTTWDGSDLARRTGIPDAADASLDEDWRLLRCYMQDSLGEFPPRKGFSRYLEGRFGATEIRHVAEHQRGAFVQTILRREFLSFLQSRELAGLLENKFGSADIRKRCCGTPRDLLLWVETQRFWCASMARLFARLKDVGREVFQEQGRHGDFYTVANLGSMATVDGFNKRRVDGIQLPHWAPTTDMQMFEEMLQPGMLESGVIISNVFAFRWAMGAGTKAGTLLYRATEDLGADLAHAEAAAGGGGAFIEAALEAPESRRRWRKFFAEQSGLWDGGESLAQVGVLCWTDQVLYELPEHYGMVRRLVNILSETQVPFDIVTEENPGDLSQYEVLLAPMLQYVDAPEIERLLDYARAGGKLVVIEPFGTHDKFARPRTQPLLNDIRFGDLGLSSATVGRGKVLRLSAAAVPQRRSDHWNLMEERGNDFALASEVLDPIRQEEQARGTDLGPAFIERIEKAFGVRLRWCPDDTDPGVYLHAYHVPSKGDRPERLVIHLVNYRMPIRVKSGAPPSTLTIATEPTPFGNLRIVMPLPAGATVKDVRAVSPTENVLYLQWTAEGGQLKVELDPLRVYQAIVADLR